MFSTIRRKEDPMKPLLPLLAATLAGALTGCANWPGSGGQQPQYVPMQGGPGYGPTGPLSRYNAAPEGSPPSDMPTNSDEYGGYGGGGQAGSGTRSSGMSGSGASGMSETSGNASGGASGSEGTGSAGMSGARGGTAGAANTGAPLDQQSMCELQRRVTAARTPEERQALLEQALPGMTPETQERHLQIMSESCQ
jgi:hypothetical protein